MKVARKESLEVNQLTGKGALGWELGGGLGGDFVGWVSSAGKSPLHTITITASSPCGTTAGVKG